MICNAFITLNGSRSEILDNFALKNLKPNNLEISNLLKVKLQNTESVKRTLDNRKKKFY
jgi:hypothetical protein